MNDCAKTMAYAFYVLFNSNKHETLSLPLLDTDYNIISIV